MFLVWLIKISRQKLIAFKYQSSRLYFVRLSFICFVFLESPPFYILILKRGADTNGGADSVLEMVEEKYKASLQGWRFLSPLLHLCLCKGVLIPGVLVSVQEIVGMLIWIQKETHIFTLRIALGEHFSHSPQLGLIEILLSLLLRCFSNCPGLSVPSIYKSTCHLYTSSSNVPSLN